MARKTGGSAQRMAPLPTTYGRAKATAIGNPPPSTIAAQIVHNATNINSRQDAATKVTFGELVKEFLQHPSTDEPDPQLVALICVIAEAGLEGLSTDDPFAQDQQRQQGLDSIAALKFLIQQKPHLLLSAKDGGDDSGPQPPLFVWLCPKLLGLLTHTTLQPIHQNVRDLLSLCPEILFKTPIYWRRAVEIVQLYKSNVQCQ
jgi:serine/threonine-protein kinase ATR